MPSATAFLSGNLPAEPNSFIGRERDLAELARLLGAVRALTLSGPGGIGKTRLAVKLACQVIAGPGGEPESSGVPCDLDEAWLVELADWHGPVAQHVAAAIGVREEPGVPLAQTLAEALRSRHMLLILDTCEHQVGDCATLCSSSTPASTRSATAPPWSSSCWPGARGCGSSRPAVSRCASAARPSGGCRRLTFRPMA